MQVRELLASGQVQQVGSLLGRPFRLVAALPDPQQLLLQHPARTGALEGARVLPATSFLNQAPAPGWYRCGAAVVLHRPAGQGQGQGQGRSGSSSGGLLRSGEGSLWSEPLALPLLLPDNSWQAEGSGSGQSEQSSNGNGNSAAMDSGIQGGPQPGCTANGYGSGALLPTGQQVVLQAVLDIQLGPDGLYLTPGSAGLLDAVMGMGHAPGYLVLDFDSALTGSSAQHGLPG